LNNFKSFKSLLYTINEQNAQDIALALFRFQAERNPVYGNYIRYLNVKPDRIKTIKDIPFLPISFFKSQVLQTDSWSPETVFTSSGTTGNTTSSHLVADLDFYREHSEKCFTHFFGSLEQYHIFALMPSYLERKDSSLIAMLENFIRKTNSPYSGFYLYEHEKLVHDIRLAKKDNKKIILWGVSFALLDLAENFSLDLSDCMLIETGGMKGRRKEITRPELHEQLKKHFNVSKVYSEYGMTELLSQSYTQGGSLFYPSPWMRILVRDVYDPLEKGLFSQSGGLNVIDFANFHSISFIETEDAGKTYPDGSFEVAGRLDNSDARGCNLMVE
jgi:phenylacetate-coenzyme A ligase PaaK-like adenylate-forming protein